MGSRRSRRRRARRSPPGTPPGTLGTVPDTPAPRIRVFGFGPDACDEHAVPDADAAAALLGKHAVTWIDVAGLGDPAVIERFGTALDLHRLALEDVLHVDQRPKVEEYGRVAYIVLRMVGPDGNLDGEQLSLFLGERFVATFQERADNGDCLDPVRERIRGGGPRLRQGTPSYLAYAILDTVVDAYFPVLEKLGDRLESIEDGLLESPSPALARDLHVIRRDLLLLRRSIWPLRDVLGTLLRAEGGAIDPSLAVYFRDCQDHAIRLLDLVEINREVANGLLELYLSLSSYRVGEITKVLTVVATIFIPLSFLAGLWGMNFDTSLPGNMPELEWRYGYRFALGVMAAVAGGMLVFFRRRGWI